MRARRLKEITRSGGLSSVWDILIDLRFFSIDQLMAEIERVAETLLLLQRFDKGKVSVET